MVFKFVFIKNLFHFFLGILNGPDIRKLVKSDAFNEILTDNELIAWDSIKAILHGLLGKHRVNGYEVLVENMLDAFHKIEITMSLKIHFLHRHLDFFAKQLPTESDEQGERFHQVIMPMETRFKGKKLDAMLCEVCWWSCQINRFKSTTNEGEEEEESVDNEEFLNTSGSSGESNSDDPDKVQQPPKRTRR